MTSNIYKQVQAYRNMQLNIKPNAIIEVYLNKRLTSLFFFLTILSLIHTFSKILTKYYFDSPNNVI